VALLDEDEDEETESFKDLTIKGLNQALYLQVKAEAIRRGMAIGEVMNEAMEGWLRSNQLDSLRKWKLEIMSRIEHLDDVMEQVGLPEEGYRDNRQEYKRDLERVNRQIEKLEDLVFSLGSLALGGKVRDL
jgi:hypothetical protein